MIIRIEEDKVEVIEEIQALDLSKPWRVDIELFKRNRSLAANRLYWKWLGVIADHTGHNKDELHCELAYRYLEPMIITIDDKPITMVRSTATLNTKEFTDYLNDVEMFAHDLGLRLPHPGDLYYEAMVKGVENGV